MKHELLLTERQVVNDVGQVVMLYQIPHQSMQNNLKLKYLESCNHSIIKSFKP